MALDVAMKRSRQGRIAVEGMIRNAMRFWDAAPDSMDEHPRRYTYGQGGLPAIAFSHNEWVSKRLRKSSDSKIFEQFGDSLVPI